MNKPFMTYREERDSLIEQLAAMTEQRDQWRRKHEAACDTLTTVRQERSQYIALLKRRGAELKQREADCAAIGDEAAGEFNQHHAEMLALLDQKDAELAATQLQLKEAREALDSYDFKVFRRQQPKDVIDHICYNINRRWSEDLVSPWIVEAVISGLFYSAKSEADELFSRPADTTALDRYVAEELRRMADNWVAHWPAVEALRNRADELEGK